MPKGNGVVQDTVTGLYCTTYSTDLASCAWGNGTDAVLFSTLAAAQATAANMNDQFGSDTRFIGTNPPPH